MPQAGSEDSWPPISELSNFAILVNEFRAVAVSLTGRRQVRFYFR
jgi:hypothetical protein